MRITELYHKLMEIDALSETLANDYEHIIEEIEISEEMNELFRKTFDFNGHDIYMQIHEIEEETKHIRVYAVGIQKDGENVARYDNRDHHQGLTNPPNHKHIGADEKVFDFDGRIDTLVQELSEIHLPKIM